MPGIGYNPPLMMNTSSIAEPAASGAFRSMLGGLAAALLLAFALLVPGGAAWAGDPAASPWFETDQGRVRLVAAAPQIGTADAVLLGLEFRLAPGWDIYWRSPGDAGLPPHVDWSGSRNLAAATFAWPAPRRFSAYGLETIGYQGSVVLPIAARLEHQGEGLSLHAALDYLTCKDICIPYDTVLSLDLPVESAASGGYADLIEHYAREVPGDGAASGLRLTAARLVSGKTPTLELSLAARDRLTAPDAFIEGPAGLAFGAPHASVAADGKSALLAIPVSGAAAPDLAGRTLRVTIVDGPLSLDAGTTLRAPPPREATRLLVILGIALLGGFVLNFMPCVLPVLSIKFLSMAAHSGRPRAAIRRGFLASAAGILAAFLLLAGVLILLRTAGLAVGWGLQFQHPAFLVLMSALLALFAGNLAGLFEIALPRWMGGLAERGAGTGGQGGYGGDFFAGVLATLLATPCSAPFLGTAIGFALAGDSLDIVTVFLALGVGLAVPYLTVAALPVLAARLPRPGAWMLTARRILAALLAASALWLLSVLASQAGVPAAVLVAVALLASLGFLWRGRAASLRRAGAGAAIIPAFVPPLVLPAPAPPVVAADALWRGFDRSAIDRLVGEGKIVFVDVTADWCINCKVNERLVLQSDAVRRRLASADVVAMRADWTRPDSAIAAFLQDFGRYGIPFYAVYGPATPDGQPLSEILTPGEVLSALGNAAPAARPVAGTGRPPTRGG
jgi:suppressor for copper-sensitivity B